MFSGATFSVLAGIGVSIPDRVLGVFRLNEKWGSDYSQKVSIPDRVLGVFRHGAKLARVERTDVSIPDRVLGVFRRNKHQINSDFPSFNP